MARRGKEEGKKKKMEMKIKKMKEKRRELRVCFVAPNFSIILVSCIRMRSRRATPDGTILRAANEKNRAEIVKSRHSV